MNFLAFQTVWLWSDVLLWALVLVLGTALWRGWQHPPLQLAWQKVGRKPGAMVCAALLLAFMAVGLLDSLHFRPALPLRDGDSQVRYATEVRSVLDVLL